MITRRSARQALRRTSEPETEAQADKKHPKHEKKGPLSKQPNDAAGSSQPTDRVIKRTVAKPVGENETNPKRRKHDQLDFRSTDVDPIIENLKGVSPELDTVLDDEILTQIALEGLAGITFGRLLRILDAIFPSLHSAHNENSQSYIWSIIVDRYCSYPQGAGVSAFHLDPNHNSVSDSDSSSTKKIVVDKPINLPMQTLERMARRSCSLYPIQDGPIMGSCAKYSSRTDITGELIEIHNEAGAPRSIDLANGRYCLENIFFVAAQDIRRRSLLPEWVDPNMNIKLREYCTLELIGRFRSLGAVFPNDKTLGRYRLMLLAKDFISQYQQNNSSPIIHHLKRFAKSRPPPAIQTASEKNSRKALVCYTKDKDDDVFEQTTSELCCDPSKMKPGQCTLSTVYDVIAQSIDGVTQIDIRQKLHMPKFHLRNHLKNLLSLKMICSYANKDPDNPFRIYKPAHKFRRKLKLLESAEKPKGIMANWDEADLRAKRIIGHKRSSFSQAEDSLLILCRITSILIDPKCRLSWCVNKRLVRDLLHNELVESHDKTSDACLRRIKYLKRLPNNIMSINELTAELQDDVDIRELIGDKKNSQSEHKLNKLFTKVLNIVRAKIPNLLGIASTIQTTFGHQILAIKGPKIGANESIFERKQLESISDHNELLDKYELIDCQSVASINRAPTYERAKNQVDVKFNSVALVIMAFTLASSLEKSSSAERSGSPSEELRDELNLGEESRRRRAQIRKRGQSWLLEKFFAGYPDKLVNSVLSKLNKRSLLTRKCAADQASLYKPKSKMSLKLNQSVLFLLNRYQSSSLIQLAHPISQLYGVELEASNDMASMALLTSLCSFGSFDLGLDLAIPANVVAIDQGNENFKSLCAKANERVREMLTRVKQQDFRTLYKCGSLADCLIVQPCSVRFHSKEESAGSHCQPPNPICLIDEQTTTGDQHGSQQHQPPTNQQTVLTNWLVKSFEFPKDKELNNDKDYEANKIPIEYQARLWRSIDGSVNIPSLFKLIESLLSWITVFPGLELELLKQEFSHLMPHEHLLELLDLMEKLELISCQVLEARQRRPRLFGFSRTDERSSTAKFIGSDKKTYEPTAHSFIRYCQLLHYRWGEETI